MLFLKLAILLPNVTKLLNNSAVVGLLVVNLILHGAVLIPQSKQLVPHFV